MKIELTRGLLERYLRATKDPGLRDLTEMMDDGCSVRGILDSHIHSDGAEFRLGLCAAAEHAIANIAHYPADVFQPLGNSTECISARMAIHTSRALADQLLRAAGIEPDAWEDAK